MQSFDFFEASKAEIPCCLKLNFPNLPPLILDGKKRLVRIVSRESYHKKSADFVLKYDNVLNFDM